MSAVIGIDLGTSTTEAAVFKDAKPVLLLNPEGEAVTPSAVGIDTSGNWVVGERARAQQVLYPENTAVEVKRLMGTSKQVTVGKREYSPVEISSRLLEYVRNYASSELGEDVSRAVISVPAYFNDIQRQETILAGRMAGFEVERIINEPTAAALAYGLEHLDEESHILVYDLGGGTFDVTLLEMFAGVLEVKASSGDNALGGKDFDERLVEFLVGHFSKKYKIDIKKDLKAMARVRDEAIRCKIALSTKESYRVELPMLAEKDGKPLAMEENISRTTFENLTKELMERTHVPIQTVLDDAGLRVSDITKIILVGGSTRMPMVAADIESFLGKKPEDAVNPDYAVAEGAAIQAGIISGAIDPEDSLVMTDVNPYTLGIKSLNWLGGVEVTTIIPRNTTIPSTKKETFCTTYYGQTEVKIEVYQGESRIPENNNFLGEFNLDGIPPAPAHEEKITVEFSYDLNGMLGVKATIDSTGKDAGIRINMMEVKKDSKRRKRAAEPEIWKDAVNAKKYRAVIRRAERLLKNSDPRSGDISEILEELKEAIIDNDEILAQSLERELVEVMSDE